MHVRVKKEMAIRRKKGVHLPGKGAQRGRLC